MKKVRIYPYKMNSQSAAQLSKQLQGLRVREESHTYHPKSNHIIINWGNSHYPSWNHRIQNHFINCTESVQIAYNKLLTFRRLSDCSIPIPEYKLHKEDTTFWIEQGHKIFCRTNLTGHSGQGIVLASTIEELVEAPLYTKYTKCKQEYRVHVMNGQIIDFVLKRKRNGIDTTPYIRNHSNGWVYTREGIILPNKVKEAALKAIQALDLDFGAVDIGYKINEDKVFVYEINTAPGLEGTTLQRYTQAFKENYLV